MPRPRGLKPSAKDKAAGYGRVGFCKLCNHEGTRFLTGAILRGEAEGKSMTAADMLKYMRVLDPDFNADRHTFYKHKADHLTSPLVTAAEKTRRESPKILPKDNHTALEMIRDEGMKSLIEHPESITVDHTIKAIAEMEKKSRGPEGLWGMVIALQSGQQPEQIVGDYTEINELETTEEPLQEAATQ